MCGGCVCVVETRGGGDVSTIGRGEPGVAVYLRAGGFSTVSDGF